MLYKKKLNQILDFFIFRLFGFFYNCFRGGGIKMTYTLRSRPIIPREEYNSLVRDSYVQSDDDENSKVSSEAWPESSSSEEAQESEQSVGESEEEMPLSSSDSEDLESFPSSAAALQRREVKRLRYGLASHENPLLEIVKAEAIIGRDSELEAIMRILADEEKKRFVLLRGSSGIGKTSLVKKIQVWIDEKKAPENLRNSQVLMIDAGKILASCELLDVNRVIQRFKNCVEKGLRGFERPILYVRNLDKIAALVPFDEYFLSTFLGKIPCLASTQENLDKIENSALRSFFDLSFEHFEIKECAKQEAKEIVRKKFMDRKFSLDESVVSLAVDFSSNYFKSEVLPKKAIFLMEQSYQQARLEKALNGDSNKDLKVTSQHVMKIVSEKTGLSEEGLSSNQDEFVHKLRKKLLKEVVGQQKAVNAIVDAFKVYKRGLQDPSKPWGVFLLVGSTGVGKTHLCKQLANELFPSERGFFRFDMSEYVENHNVSRLIGAPPGYEGNQMGGQLTEALRRYPHSVILLDEIEKAHGDVLRLFLQVFDEGRLTDGRGNMIDCSKALFLMTSNLGSASIIEKNKKCQVSHEDVLQTTRPFIIDHLRPELFNRITAVLPFRPLQKSDLPLLIELEKEKIQKRLTKSKSCKVTFTKALRDYFLSQASDLSFGARAFSRLVESNLSQVLADSPASILESTKISIDYLRGSLVAKKQT